MKKLKSTFLLASALTIAGIAPVVITTTDNTNISTYDQSPAAARSSQVATQEGYRVSSSNVDVTIAGITYTNVKMEVYLTSYIYMYNDSFTGIYEVVENSNTLAFYVKLDFSSAMMKNSNVSYEYNTGDEDYMRVNLYPASYDSIEDNANYQDDIMYADFYRDGTTEIFYSYQIVVPQLEMGWELEIVNDVDATATNQIDYIDNSSTVSVYNDSYLISDYWTDSVGGVNNYYNYEPSDQKFIENPFYSQKDLTNLSYDSTTNKLTIEFSIFFNYDNNQNISSSISSNYYINNEGSYYLNYCEFSLAGYLYLPIVGTNKYTIMEIDKFSSDTSSCYSHASKAGITTTYTSTRVDTGSHHSSYTVSYEYEYTFDFSSNSTINYDAFFYTYDPDTASTNSIYHEKELGVVQTDLFTFTSQSESDFDSYYDWTKVQYYPSMVLDIQGDVDINNDGDTTDQINNTAGTYPDYDAQTIYESNIGVNYKRLNYTDYVIYTEQVYDDSIAATPSIDNSGDIGTTVIGWLFLGMSISLIVGISYYLIRKNKLAKARYDEKLKFIKKGESLNGK